MLNQQIRIALFAVSILVCNSVNAQSIQSELENAIKTTHPEKVDLFDDELTDGNEVLAVNYSELSTLIESDDRLIQLSIPCKTGVFELTMMRYEISGHIDKKGIYDGEVYTEMPTEKSIHYRGVVAGNETAWVSFSFSKNRLKGLIATNDGNWIIDKKKGTEDYVIYLDSEHPGRNMTCETADFGELPELNTSAQQQKKQSCPITLFWLADYDFYYLHGNDYNACLFDLDAIFNSVAALYQQEGISMNLGSRYAYTGPDPYNSADIFGTWVQFGSNIHQDLNFLGHDLAMLINVDQVNGPAGYAVIDALCDNSFYFDQFNPNNTQGRFAATRIEYYYYNYPTYSSTVEVISHELGHNLSSRHTHWCGWPGGAIDGCAAVEPNNSGVGCTQPPPAPTNSASLMSYCSLYYGLGSVPLTNGFGFYPNQAISSAVSFYDACICSGLSTENPIEAQFQLEIIPNPSDGMFSVSNNGTDLELEQIAIYDMAGGLQKRFENGTEFDCSDLNSGVYLVSGIYKTNVFTLRLLID